MEKDMLKKNQNIKSKEEFLALLKENGVDISNEKADELYAQIKSHREIGDDDIGKVSGGVSLNPEGLLKTTIVYDCSLFEYAEGAVGPKGICYMCKYWSRNIDCLSLEVMGQTGKCMHPENIKIKE